MRYLIIFDGEAPYLDNDIPTKEQWCEPFAYGENCTIIDLMAWEYTRNLIDWQEVEENHL